VRLAALLLALCAGPAGAFVGAFPVCDAKPQYVRLEVAPGFAPADCIAAAARARDYRPALLLLVGVVMPVCAATGIERATLYLDPAATDDAVLGHELRHAFPPVHSHPYLLPWLSSAC
jgi:hypothetical protein